MAAMRGVSDTQGYCPDLLPWPTYAADIRSLAVVAHTLTLRDIGANQRQQLAIIREIVDPLTPASLILH